MVVKVIVSISGIDSVIIRLVCRLREKKFISRMIISVLVSIWMNLLILVCIVVGWLDILCSFSLVGSDCCRWVNLVFRVLFSIRMLLFGFIVIVRLMVFLFMKCMCGVGGLLKLWWILVMLLMWKVWLLMWMGKLWIFFIELKCLEMCNCMWLLVVLKNLEEVIVFCFFSVFCIVVRGRLRVVSLVLDRLI